VDSFTFLNINPTNVHFAANGNSQQQTEHNKEYSKETHIYNFEIIVPRIQRV
jgi:hypothetical protein